MASFGCTIVLDAGPSILGLQYQWRAQLTLVASRGDVLLVPAVIAHMVAQADVVVAHDLAIMQRAVLGPIHCHSPADGLLVSKALPPLQGITAAGQWVYLSCR